jgi:hypothetical protein
MQERIWLSLTHMGGKGKKFIFALQGRKTSERKK